jgi:very-short-patch-repair endonuclease
MSIDIALLDHKIAIECDGPSHFEKNMEKSMTHKTIIRNRGLERRGWRVVSIPYFEWQEANANETHRKYLEDKLASVGVQREQVLTLF